RRTIGQLIKYTVNLIAILIVSIIVSAYVWYFVGMAVFIAAGKLFGLASSTFVSIFAWMGVGAVVTVAITIVIKIITDVIDAFRYKVMAEELLEQLKE